MEYQKIIDFLDNKQNKPSRFRIGNLVEMIDESRGTYNNDNQIKFKMSIIRSNLYDYSDAYILASRTIKTDWKEDNNSENKKMEEIKEQYLKIVRHLLSAWVILLILK